MKKSLKYTSETSVRDLFDYTEPDSYTRQTLAAIFRCFPETVIEDGNPAVILLKVNNTQGFQGVLNRLKYTDVKVYSYSDDIEGFNTVTANHPGLKNDEFLIVLAERFSACIYRNEAASDVFGLCEGFCSMNPAEVKRVVEFLQEIAYDKNLEKDLSNILQDRRNNEKFTTILRKLVKNLESRQRDLICANAELKELCQKSVQEEKPNLSEEFCSEIIHELRNPLGMINLHSKIIAGCIEKIGDKKMKESETVLNSAKAIGGTIEHLENILSELKDYSKPLSLKKTEGNPENIVSEVINLIKPSFEKNNVGLSFENLLTEKIEMSFDKTKIYRALLNLVKNALEASKPGGNVKLTCVSGKEPGSVCIKIADEGSGIPSAIGEKIFIPFFTSKKNGTGLGLPQSKKIAEAHGGSLLIELTGETGTTFVLTLPSESAYIYTT